MEFLAVMIVALALRVLFLITPSTDDVVHLWNVRLRRRHGDFSSHDPLDSVLEGMRGYPTLAHWMVSWFPRHSWRKAGKLLNIAWDCCLIVLVFLLTAKLCGGWRLYPAAAGMLVATSPLLLPITARMKSMGGRTLGGLLCFIGLFFIYLAMNGQEASGLVFSTVCGLGIVLSSKFTLQFWLMGLPFIALFTKSFVPLSVLGITLVVSMILPGLGLRDILAFEWAHTRAYREQWKKGTTASSRNRPQDLIRLPHYLRNKPNLFLAIIFRRSSFIVALMGFPLVWPMVCAWSDGLAKASDAVVFCMQVTGAALALFILVSYRPLSFLGQAERYLEYAVPFAAIATALAWAHDSISDQTMLFLVAFQTAVVVANFCYGMLGKFGDALSTPEPLEVAIFLSTLRNRRVLTVPLKLAFALSLNVKEGLGHTFYYRAINQPGTGMAYKKRDCIWFDTPRPDLEHFTICYGVDTFVANKQFVDNAANPPGYDFAGYDVLYEDNEYIVIDLEKKQ